MSSVLILTIFVIGYLLIAMEHPLRLNKAASALITGVLCWTIHILSAQSPQPVVDELMHHLGEIASILFFLLGAMTIVELIDSHGGFDIVTQRLNTTNLTFFLTLVTILTFFLSAILDNLTTAIVMTSMSAKLISTKEDRLWIAGMIVIAANAGGAWSPLGDVTTTMLWIGGQVTAWHIIKTLFLPSISACLVPFIIVAFRFRGRSFTKLHALASTKKERKEGQIILIAGFGFLLFVPIFKTITHLPPFMAMLLSLGLMWIINSLLHKGKEPAAVKPFTVATALQKIDTPSILFFLGILLAVSALQSFGTLNAFASLLVRNIGNDYMIGAALGLLSSIVDNVPLVAAAQGMFDLSTYPTDHPFWSFLALTTGTGGSAIIIGSAAGVAVMGIEKINFLWYLKKISWLALVGFSAAIIVFVLLHK